MASPTPTPPNAFGLAQLQALADASPFIRHCQMEVIEADAAAGVVKMRMPLLPHLRRDAAVAQFHGGPVASLIDTAGDFAVALAVGGGVGPGGVGAAAARGQRGGGRAGRRQGEARIDAQQGQVGVVAFDEPQAAVGIIFSLEGLPNGDESI